ncbi:DUF4148 domain-containing protein [Caballeronia sp. LZ032]|uniref:DUF4148 domain-containing protein n=1 Tax=Caballeronia sp. LZ032 TaxID=3038565 RepID=UPI00285E3CDB|nr:DUF4148 domain-containing protein [Caballeronia sp. LZ032]MDR5882388.1 DUF4148 domain-containing protein [Caballeronia sp. LZ032]
MKAIATFVVSLAVAVSSSLVFAQDHNAPLTRAQVKAELAQLEQAGYSPATGEEPNYPNDIQAAEAKVAAQRAAAGDAHESYGGSQAGAAAAGSGPKHMPMQHGSMTDMDCVGPSGFCKPFFGS